MIRWFASWSARRPCRFVPAALSVLAGLLLYPAVASADTQVGETKDGCDAQNVVHVGSRNGSVAVGPHETKRIELPAMQSDIFFYCGGTRERQANDRPFNVVEMSRAPNGHITSKFIVSNLAPLARVPNMVQVGDTFDGCDGHQPVTFPIVSNQTATVGANTIRLVQVPALEREINGKCGTDGLRAANPAEFDFVQIERAGNGAVHWRFYRTLTADAPDVGVFLHNLRGDLTGAAVIGGNTFEQSTPPAPGALKTMLDGLWTNNIAPQVQPIVQSAIGSDSRVTIDRNGIIVASPATTELRLRNEPKDVVVKYIAHGNRVNAHVDCIAASCGVSFVFDLEVVARLQRQTPFSKGLVALSAFIEPRHMDYELNDVNAKTHEEVLNPILRAKATTIEATPRDITSQLNAALGALWNGTPQQPGLRAQFPEGINLAFLDLNVEPAGRFTVCGAMTATDVCKFKPQSPPPPAPVVPRTLDSAHNDCGEDVLWMWDVELGRFQPIRKGQQIAVQVDSRRMDWYCGSIAIGSTRVPNTLSVDHDTGPINTFSVLVKRDSTGRAFHTDFRFWR